MSVLSLEQAYQAIVKLPREDRAAATQALVGALTSGLNYGHDWTALDPLECTPDRAAHCLSAGEAVTVGSQVCLSALDPGIVCPFGARSR